MHSNARPPFPLQFQWAVPGQHADVVYKSSNEIFVLIDLTALDKQALATNFLRGNLDFKFVLFACFGNSLIRLVSQRLEVW